jgi:hypothetical protein
MQGSFLGDKYNQDYEDTVWSTLHYFSAGGSLGDRAALPRDVVGVVVRLQDVPDLDPW